METNVCDVNRLDSDVLLPPRKRLLACLKKQNGDGNGSFKTPSACNALKELDSRISYLLKAHLSNDNPSQEEIVVASRAAAEVAVKTAMAARAAAQEKAIIAAKAMSAAKKALEIVATFDDDNDDDKDISCSVEQESKNKMKKQVEVQMLYNNKKPRLENGKPSDEESCRKLGQDIFSSVDQDLKNKMEKQIEVQMLYNNKKPRLENGKPNDEELARKLHQAINSSPRISKSGAPSNINTPKPKKLKSLENVRVSNGSIVAKGISPSNDKQVVNMKKSNMENGSKPKSGDDDITTIGRKRGRMKQKKLPLSICHDRDQATLKEDGTSKSPLSVGASASSAVERSSLWKCQAFKAPVCVKQNKVMQS